MKTPRLGVLKIAMKANLKDLRPIISIRNEKFDITIQSPKSPNKLLRTNLFIRKPIVPN